MKILKNTWFSSTFGQLSIAFLFICIVTGIILAIPFDVTKPYESISLFMIANPAASLIRNLHYWSAQFFFVSILFHIWDHLKKKEKIKLKRSVWLRMSIGVLIIFLAMLSGFLLKEDADSLQARQILKNLVSAIPLIGNFLTYSLLGNDDNLQLIYVHHIATFTIFIVIIIFEHHREFWPRWKEFVVSSAFILLISFFISAPLHDGLNPTIKGPWYFLGLQEILHWLTLPQLSLLFLLIFFMLIYLIPFANKKMVFFTKLTLLTITITYLLLTITGLFFRGPNWQFIIPFEKNYTYKALPQLHWSALNFLNEIDFSKANASPLINGHKESCIVCHDNVSGFSPSHNSQSIGCYSCHGGNPFQSDKVSSHFGMKLIPGNLEDADRSCGTSNCHPKIAARIQTSLMTTLSGMISVDRFVFNENDDLNELSTVHQLGNSAADVHLKNMCVICHLGNPKTETGPVTESSRGGGCLACHLNYDQKSADAFFAKKNNPADTAYLHFHPSIDLQVSDDHCFGCHNRSGRISTNYEGWHETTLKASEKPQNDQYRLVENTRVFKYVNDDIHHELGLSCIDCHNSYELMGDGNFYAHQEEPVTIQCEDCHFTTQPNIVDQKNLDQESAIIASMRFGDISNRVFLTTNIKKRALINTFIKNDTAFLITKIDKKIFALKKPSANCTKGDAHNTLSCDACHTSWAPSCIGCHNEYDQNEQGYNMIENKFQSGTWVEYTGEYNVDAPALGKRITVSGNIEKEKVVPVVPGMVLTIDVASFDKSTHDSLIFQRLFAPLSPHTTQKAGRDCKSCHNNPVALGFGKGKLELITEKFTSFWTFDATYQNNKNDGLPEDAWTGFLKERDGAVSTRKDIRPFTVKEQKNILTVGACLTCHDDNSIEMQHGLLNFDSTFKKRSERCLVPDWNN